MSRLQGLTAQRFAGKPLRQPSYSMRSVPYCNSTLSGSTIGEVSNRDHFNDSMAEMVLLCNEVMRRKASIGAGTGRDANASICEKEKKAASKPLSLEYLADRCDVDDPIWGFIVRTAGSVSAEREDTAIGTNSDCSITSNVQPKSKTHQSISEIDRSRKNKNVPHQNNINKHDDKASAGANSSYTTNANSSIAQEGMLQGFITVTTFTNWQKSFRWDSMHDSAFSYDEPDVAKAMASKERKFDEDGSLAAQIQNTVRCGDPWNEGIVWPRVAEISLLGALGCGRVLLSLAIERLESMQPTAKHNYDYVVLQATSNSIPFYESMGFVRVGAVTEKYQEEKTKKQLSSSSDSNSDVGDVADGITSGPIKKIKTDQRQPLRKLCKSLNVDVWDVIFLNNDIFPGILPLSVIQKDTELFIPDVFKLDGSSNASNARSSSFSSLHDKQGERNTLVTQWYDAKDNETPREIAKKFNLDLKELLGANKGRIQGLQQHSKLVENTRIQVSNLDVHYDEHVPYCHWTFPDDKFENNEPSYMMARKLNRKSRKGITNKPVESSLAVKITKYEPPQNVQILESQKNILNQTPKKKTPKKSKKRKLHPDQPLPPKRPKSGYFFFLDEEREKMKARRDSKLSTKEFFRVASAKWKEMKDRTAYDKMREQALTEHEKEMKEYHAKMEKFRAEHPDWVEEIIETPSPVVSATKMAKNLFNKVVKLTEEGRREAGTEFQYFFVLTYIPDLFWCHLAPMRRKGTFGSRWPKVKGRTRWVLVGEDEGKELDISAAVCQIVKSRCMKRCDDADMEEWDINDADFKRSLNTSTAEATPSMSSVSISSTSAKETLISSGESDNELDSPKNSPKASLIKADTMYSRLLRHQ